MAACFTGVVLERGTLAFLNIQPGGTLRLQNPQGQVSELPVTGVGHDLYQANPVISAGGAGYVSAETLRQLGGPQGVTQLHIQLRPAAWPMPKPAPAASGRRWNPPG